MPHCWDPIAPLVEGLVLPVKVDPTGEKGPTRAQARGPRWRCCSYGRFVPREVSDEVVEQRILEAYDDAGPLAVVSGWAATRLLGGGHFDGLARDGKTPLPVPIAANGERVRSRPGRVVTRLTIPDDEVVVVHGMRCARPERALFDEMRRIGWRREMAVAADSAYAAQLTSLDRMRLYCATRRWYRDVRTVAEAIELSAEGSRSPQESRFRHIREYDAGWDRPIINRSIFDLDGRLLGVPDLLDPGRGVVGEYAGADHRDVDQHGSDIEREAAFRAVGLEYVEVVAKDLRMPDRVVKRMREAEHRTGQHPRLWQLGPPLSPTLDQILDAGLAPWQRRVTQDGC